MVIEILLVHYHVDDAVQRILRGGCIEMSFNAFGCEAVDAEMAGCEDDILGFVTVCAVFVYRVVEFFFFQINIVQ